MNSVRQKREIPGTAIFDGDQARKGYALNKMCFSFNSAANREEFLRDEQAYCRKYGLNAQQREAIRNRNVLELIAAGGNVYYLAKFAGIFLPRCPGYRRAADWNDQGGLQGQAGRSGEVVMARIVGGFTTTHVPAIGRAIARNLQQDPYWKPFFDGFLPAREWLARTKPDVAVVVYNDHRLNFFLDKMPTFSVGAAPEYQNADEGWGIPTLPPHVGDQDLSWHLIESLVAEEFDITTCQEMLVDHAFTLPLALLWPDQDKCPVRTVPVCINTVQFPLPSAARCYKLGQAIGRAIESSDEDARVVIIGTGDLSHRLDGQRLGLSTMTST